VWSFVVEVWARPAPRRIAAVTIVFWTKKDNREGIKSRTAEVWPRFGKLDENPGLRHSFPLPGNDT